MKRDFASTLASPQQLARFIEEDNELLPQSKDSLMTLVRMGHIQTIEQLDEQIGVKKRLDGTCSNSTLASPQQLARIIEEDNELLPQSKDSLMTLVRMGHIQTIEQLDEQIGVKKRLDGTCSNSTLASPQQLARIIEEDNELLPQSKDSLMTLVRMGHIQTIEQLDEHIEVKKRLDGRL